MHTSSTNTNSNDNSTEGGRKLWKEIEMFMVSIVVMVSQAVFVPELTVMCFKNVLLFACPSCLNKVVKERKNEVGRGLLM